MRSLRRLLPLALLLLAAPAGRLWASPQDSKVGDTRVTYSKQGTVLRADAAPVADAHSCALASCRRHVNRAPWRCVDLCR